MWTCLNRCGEGTAEGIGSAGSAGHGASLICLLAVVIGRWAATVLGRGAESFPAALPIAVVNGAWRG